MSKFFDEKMQVSIELDEETYWNLVKMGAEIRTPIDQYIENLLQSHVMDYE